MTSRRRWPRGDAGWALTCGLLLVVAAGLGGYWFHRDTVAVPEYSSCSDPQAAHSHQGWVAALGHDLHLTDAQTSGCDESFEPLESAATLTGSVDAAERVLLKRGCASVRLAPSSDAGYHDYRCAFGGTDWRVTVYDDSGVSTLSTGYWADR